MSDQEPQLNAAARRQLNDIFEDAEELLGTVDAEFRASNAVLDVPPVNTVGKWFFTGSIHSPRRCTLCNVAYWICVGRARYETVEEFCSVGPSTNGALHAVRFTHISAMEEEEE